MKPARRILSVVAAAGVILTAAPALLWADSAAPTGNAADFLAGVNCPDPNSSTIPCYNPNASGTKFAGTLAVVYGKTSGCVNNVFFNLTLQQGNLLLPFTTDYLYGVRPHAVFAGSCPSPGDNQAEQVKVIIDLIHLNAIPIFYACGGSGQPSCPSFQVKDISNFVSTTGPLSSPSSDGFSADVTIAVR